MKKILSLILALTILLSLCVGLTSCADLADIAIDVLTEGIDETGETGGETDADEPPTDTIRTVSKSMTSEACGVFRRCRLNPPGLMLGIRIWLSGCATPGP